MPRRSGRLQAAFGLRPTTIENLPRTYAQLLQIIAEEDVTVEPYAPRSRDVQQMDYHRKWAGQRKLLLAEIEFLLKVMRCDDVQNTDSAEVVYVGAAPGHHLKLLIWLFPGIRHWHLVDPAFAVDSKTGQQSTHFRKVRHAAATNTYEYHEGDSVEYEDMLMELLHHQFKVPETVVRHHNSVIERVTLYPITATEEALDAIFAGVEGVRVLVSDIRTPWSDKDSQEEIEAKVKADMDLQRAWHERSYTRATLLKFRPPYIDADKAEFELEYLAGEIYLPVWGRWNTSECRKMIFNWIDAVVQAAEEGRTAVAPTARLGCKRFGDVMHFFNKHVREECNYEALCEALVLRAYCDVLDPASDTWRLFSVEGAAVSAVRELSVVISKILNDTRKTAGQLPLPATALGARFAAPPPLPPLPKSPIPALAAAWNRMNRECIITHDLQHDYSANRASTAALERQLQALLLPDGRHFKLVPKVTLDSYPPNKPTVVAAAMYNRVAVLELLTSKKHACNLGVVRKETGQTALHCAAYFAHLETVEWLLDHAPELRNSHGKNGETPLDAARSGIASRVGILEADFAFKPDALSPAPVAVWLHEHEGGKLYGTQAGVALVAERAARVVALLAP
jgi:hypothetical protein